MRQKPRFKIYERLYMATVNNLKRVWLWLIQPQKLVEELKRREGECRQCGKCCKAKKCFFLTKEGKCRLHPWEPFFCAFAPLSFDEKNHQDCGFCYPEWKNYHKWKRGRGK